MTNLGMSVLLKLTSMYYGAGVLFNMLWLCLRLGPRRVFGTCCRAHDKDDAHAHAPDCLRCHGLGEEAFITLPSGVRLHYVASGPEDAPLALLLHGFPEFWFSWRHQMPELARDHRVVALDQRGCGRSDQPAGVAQYHLRRLMEDVRDVITGLGHADCLLVGHDWGGIVAWAFAAHYPQLVRRMVVLNAPPTPVITRLLRDNPAQRAKSWYIFFFQLPWLPELLLCTCDYAFVDRMFGLRTPFPADSLLSCPFSEGHTTEEVAAYKHHFAHTRMTPAINWYRAMFYKGRPEYDMDFKMPILLLWGEKDFALETEIAVETKRICPDNVTLVRFPDSGHFLQCDAPRAVNAALRAWLPPVHSYSY